MNSRSKKVCKVTLICVYILTGLFSKAQICNNWLRLPSYPSYVAIGDLDIPGNQITIEAQINITEPYLGGAALGSDIVGKYADPGDVNYLLRAQNAQITTTNGFFQTPDVCDLVTNKTYHIAMVYDGATLKFYRNGFLQSQIAASGNLYQNNWITQIGFYQFAFYNVNLIGYINEVRIWNIARTQAQLNSFINTALPNPSAQAGLLAYYTFDDLTNKQGNAAWNGSLGGTAIINQVNPNCSFTLSNDCCPILSGTISGNSICTGGTGTLTFHSTTSIRQPYTIKYSDGTNSYTQTNVQDGIPFNVTVQPVNTKVYTLQSIQGASTCSPTPISGQSTTITVSSCATGSASFTAPDEVCLNTPVKIVNTSVGASSYYWNFCSTNFSQPPDAVNIGNPGNLLSGVVFAEVTQDNNGDYFVFATNNYNAHVTRLNFGNSLLNTPVADDLGNFGGLIPPHTEGIQIVNTNGRWYAIIQGGDPSAGDASSVAKIDFGTSLASANPVATNWGNVGNLNYPHKLYLFQENNRWYGYATNSNSNTITRYDFGTDFSATPTGVNLGNLGNLNLPVGITAINHGGLWYLFVLNDLDGTITRLYFGTSLLNTPVAVNIGNPHGNLVTPRDISFIELCDDIKAIVVNANPNSITQLDFGNDLTSIPATTTLGNLGNLNFPHSISKLFRVNNDIYAFIPNVNDGTLTRLRFAGCDLPGSTLKDPPPITYTQPGTYYINLLTNVGLPSQSSYCKQIVVKDCCQPLSGTLSGNSVCTGGTAMLTFHAASPSAQSFTITYSDGSTVYSQNNVLDGVPFVVAVQPLTSTTYSLLSVQESVSCPPTAITGQTAVISVGNCICEGTSGDPIVNTDFGSGANPGPALPAAAAGATTTYVNVSVSGNPASPTPVDGEYSITTNVPSNPAWFSGAPDHTSGNGTGYMAFYNASVLTGEFYRQQVDNLCGGTTYEFSAWVANVINPAILNGVNPDITFSIELTDGTPMATYQTGPIAENASLTWVQYGFLVTLPANTSSVVIKMINNNPGGVAQIGNDLAIDDITLKPCGPLSIASFNALGSMTTQTVCEGASVFLYGSVGPGYTNPESLWQISSDNGNTWTDIPNSGSFQIQVVAPVSGTAKTYLYRMLASEKNNINSPRCRIVSNQLSLLTGNFGPLLSITPDTSICTGGSVSMHVSGSNSYSWSPAQFLNDPASPNPVATPNIPMTFYVTATDVNMCVSKDSVFVNFLPPPIFKAPPDVNTCSGTPVTLNGNNNPSFLYQWSPATWFNDPAAASPSVNPDQSMDLHVTITDPVCNVNTMDYDVHVTVQPSPIVTAYRSNDIDCSNLTSQLNASGAASYSWSPATGLDKADVVNPVARLSETTRYVVQGISANGCSGSDSVTVVVTKTGQNAFSVPNAFTPNGDNVNDCFGVRNWGSVILQQFTIYNRWGQKVFETNNPSQCWDGTFHGEQQPSGGFVYMIRASSFCGDIFRKGNLLLIR